MKKYEMGKNRRSLRFESRSNNWYVDVFLKGGLNEEEFKENFRLSKLTFNKLCEDLKPYLSAKHNKLNIFWRRKGNTHNSEKSSSGLILLCKLW